jgi:hypothetical protein
MTTTLLAPSMRLANEAIAKRIVAKVRDHSPAPGLLTLGACPSIGGFCWPKTSESDSTLLHEQDIPRLED